MSIFTVNPLSLQNVDDQDEKSVRLWRSQVILSLYQLQQAVSGIATVLNGNNTLLASAFASKITDLGTITTDQTVPVGGVSFAFVRLSSAVTQTRILTLSNLPQGALVMVNTNVTANVLTLKMSATDINSNAYTIQSQNSSTQVAVDMVATGQATSGGEALFFGMTGFVGTSATPRLNLFFG